MDRTAGSPEQLSAFGPTSPRIVPLSGENSGRLPPPPRRPLLEMYVPKRTVTALAWVPPQHVPADRHPRRQRNFVRLHWHPARFVERSKLCRRATRSAAYTRTRRTHLAERMPVGTHSARLRCVRR